MSEEEKKICEEQLQEINLIKSYELVRKDLEEMQDYLIKMKACVTDIDFCAIALDAVKARLNYLGIEDERRTS